MKLEGEDGDEADDPRSFSAQGLPTELWILVAGVLMNLLLAFADLHRDRLGRDAVRRRDRRRAIQPDSPASAAGLQPGDVDRRGRRATL